MPQLSTILLVDDDSTTNFLNQSLIKRANLTSQVFVAENGHEALQLLR
ncbi:MAG: response regulator, partial [Cytophagaceae bacterium]